MAQSSSLRRPGFIVYACGVGTSVLVLGLVEVLNNAGVNIMGLYVNGIIPAGALIVGICSGVGYAVGARFLNVKLSKAFVMGMLTTGIVDYIAAQWITYMNVLERHNITSETYSFVAYVRDICENMAFKKSGTEEAGSALGMFGYFFKALEAAGFAFGIMIPCAILRGLPYCQSCQRYLKKHTTVHLYSPVLSTEVKKLPRGERLAAVQAAANDVTSRATAVLERVVSLPLEETLVVLKQADEPKVKNSTALMNIQLSKCPQCDGHHVGVTLMFTAANGQPGSKALPAIDKTPGRAQTPAPAAAAPTANV